MRTTYCFLFHDQVLFQNQLFLLIQIDLYAFKFDFKYFLFKEELYLKPKLSMFVCYLNIIRTFFLFLKK